MGGPTFHGLFLTQQEALELARSADRQSKLVQYVNFARAQESIHRIAAILRAAARSGDVTAVVVENRSEAAVMRTLLHERFHLFQNILPGGIVQGEIGERFLSNPEARRGAEAIAQRVGLPVDQVWHEVPAYIASGQGEALGYSPNEALEVFQYYLDLIREQHGQNAVDAALAAADASIREAFHGDQHQSQRQDRSSAGEPESRRGVSGVPSPGEGTPGERASRPEANGQRSGAAAHQAEVARGAQLLRDGVTRFADWSRRMLAEFGQAIRPHLTRLYFESKRLWRDTSGQSEVEIRALTALAEHAQRLARGIRTEVGARARRSAVAALLEEIGLPLEGRDDAMDDQVQQAYRVIRQITDEIAGEAEDHEVQVRTAEGQRRLFERRRDYFPHLIRNVDALRSGPVRKDVLANLVRLEIEPDRLAAEAFLDEHIAFVEGGGRREKLLRYLVSTGQAPSEAGQVAARRERGSRWP